MNAPPKLIIALYFLSILAPILRAQTATQVWVTRYNGPGNGTDKAYAVAVDSAGNVAVTGSSVGAIGRSDYYTAKYAVADGALLWQKGNDGVAPIPGYGHSVAVDSAGNVVVTGNSLERVMHFCRASYRNYSCTF